MISDRPQSLMGDRHDLPLNSVRKLPSPEHWFLTCTGALSFIVEEAIPQLTFPPPKTFAEAKVVEVRKAISEVERSISKRQCDSIYK